MPLQLLRLIDANLNRSSEGLRVLEDVARFLLNDVKLTQQLRSIRHDLASSAKSLNVKLLSQRDSGHDVGQPQPITLPSSEREMNVKAKQYQQGLPDLVTANAKRVEESLRVLAELSKLPEINSILDSTSFEQARFNLYTLERVLTSRVLRRDKLERLSGLYVVLDRQVLAGRDELYVASRIIHGGACAIQLRDKQYNKAELLPVAQKLGDLCSKEDVLFIINDYLDLAMAVDADGLHVGQGDLPLHVLRHEMPINKMVGLSVTTIPQALEAQESGVDYIAVGSIFPTTTKKDATVVGVDILKELNQKIALPLVAIGGINQNNIGEVIAAGANSVAVISAVLEEEDVEGAVQRLIANMETAKGKCQNR